MSASICTHRQGQKSDTGARLLWKQLTPLKDFYPETSRSARWAHSVPENGGVPKQDESTHTDKGSSGKLENKPETMSHL